MITCWERAELLAFLFVIFFLCFVFKGPIWCGTWLYRFLIFSFFYFSCDSKVIAVIWKTNEKVWITGSASCAVTFATWQAIIGPRAKRQCIAWHFTSKLTMRGRLLWYKYFEHKRIVMQPYYFKSGNKCEIARNSKEYFFMTYQGWLFISRKICLIWNWHLSRGMWFPTMWYLTCVDSDEPMQTPCKLRNSK